MDKILRKNFFHSLQTGVKKEQSSIRGTRPRPENDFTTTFRYRLRQLNCNCWKYSSRIWIEIAWSARNLQGSHKLFWNLVQLLLLHVLHPVLYPDKQPMCNRIGTTLHWSRMLRLHHMLFRYMLFWKRRLKYQFCCILLHIEITVYIVLSFWECIWASRLLCYGVISIVILYSFFWW